MVQVQLRVPEQTIDEVDLWIEQGRFRSRSDAIKTILELYEEREKTREFFKLLAERSGEAKEKPEILIPLEGL